MFQQEVENRHHVQSKFLQSSNSSFKIIICVIFIRQFVKIDKSNELQVKIVDYYISRIVTFILIVITYKIFNFEIDFTYDVILRQNDFK